MMYGYKKYHNLDTFMCDPIFSKKDHAYKKEIDRIREVLVDIKHGDYNRRILIKKNDTTEKICHDINEITLQSQNKLIEQKQSEQAYKSLMTSLSHDVKTP